MRELAVDQVCEGLELRRQQEPDSVRLSGGNLVFYFTVREVETLPVVFIWLFGPSGFS